MCERWSRTMSAYSYRFALYFIVIIVADACSKREWRRHCVCVWVRDFPTKYAIQLPSNAIIWQPFLFVYGNHFYSHMNSRSCVASLPIIFSEEPFWHSCSCMFEPLKKLVIRRARRSDSMQSSSSSWRGMSAMYAGWSCTRPRAETTGNGRDRRPQRGWETKNGIIIDVSIQWK